MSFKTVEISFIPAVGRLSEFAAVGEKSMSKIRRTTTTTLKITAGLGKTDGDRVVGSGFRAPE